MNLYVFLSLSPIVSLSLSLSLVLCVSLFVCVFAVLTTTVAIGCIDVPVYTCADHRSIALAARQYTLASGATPT